MNVIMILIYVVCGIYLVFNFRHDIHMLQQNSYRVKRYWKWQKPNVSSASRLVDMALLMLLFSTLMPHNIAALTISLVFIIKIIIELRKKYKKPLVFTKRVWRLYATITIIVLLLYALSIIFANDFVAYEEPGKHSPLLPIGTVLIISIFSWVFTILGVVVNTPIENSINKRYYNDAARILRSMPDLKIVGITGSFGKTSTKHYLNAILSESYDVLMTPGSYNTPMGVIRTIREMMKPYNQVFICEMGAKQLGDIKEICDLVHPQIGIITAVGEMHLETFKSIENVQRTKFELADSLPSGGLAVVNNDFEYCANRAVENVESIRYTVDKKSGSDYYVSKIEYSSLGTKFKICGKDGFSIDLETKLIGECNISNLIAAVIVAIKLDVPVEQIRYAVSRIEQVEHRLNMKRTAGGVTIIDDAFNSNPTGSRMAVDVLSHFTTGKRIIITPGMIELGSQQYELNKRLGEYISNNVDVAIIVGAYNRDSLLEGVKTGKLQDENIYVVDSFNEAQQVLSQILTSGDVVLYENDLPDSFK